MLKQVIARKNSYGKTQILDEHLKNVAKISSSISHYPNTAKLIAYLHDLGKLSDEFQIYIKNGGERGSIIHAWQGALLANELFVDNSQSAQILKEIIGFCVTAHHNYLDDGVSPDGNAKYYEKISKTTDPKYYFEEIKRKIADDDREIFLKLFNDAKPEISDFIAQIRVVYRSQNSAHFALGLFVKYIYSCLVDADRLDAYLFDIGEGFESAKPDWDNLIKIFEANIANFSNDSKIDHVRKSVSDKCKFAAEKETNIYHLSVPTGGGKTLSSLRFALHHCKKYEKKRIIYVIPYLSIIDQTSNNLRDILNLTEDNDIIFEHHSNIVEPEDEKASEIRKLSAARWDSPLIITTMVQFMESVMSAKAGKLRKFAAMADSVIIFDEIQSLPIKTIHCFNEIVSFLSKILNSTIILCSATQPTLEQTQRTNLLLSDTPKLIDCDEDFKDVKRVVVKTESEKDCVSASQFILQKAIENGNCLVIVNTKKSALDIYNQLKKTAEGFELLHLSTSMFPAHRLQIINRIKNSLKTGTKIICVATQLVEAGVDLSFSCVIRALSGLDSIAQAAGRCNRNGESTEPKTVYTFSLIDENLDKLHDIKSGKETTTQIIQKKEDDTDLLGEPVMTEFYQQYFKGKDSQMDYSTPSYRETVYAMLSENNYGKDNYKNIIGKRFPHFLAQAFHSADSNFSLIDKNTQSVVVACEEAENLFAEYCKEPAGVFTKNKVLIIKKLQKFSIALYEWQINILTEQNALSRPNEETGIIFLSAVYYSPETGVVMEASQDNLIV